MLLGATVLKVKESITFLDASADKRFVKTNVLTEMLIVNMMKHDSYEQVLPLRIATDPMPDFGRALGVVHFVRTSTGTEPNSFNSPVDHLKSPHNLTIENPELSINIDLRIPPGGQLRICRTLDQEIVLATRGGEQVLNFRALPPTEDIAMIFKLC